MKRYKNVLPAKKVTEKEFFIIKPEVTLPLLLTAYSLRRLHRNWVWNPIDHLKRDRIKEKVLIPFIPVDTIAGRYPPW
jgi:hypothetical protein